MSKIEIRGVIVPSDYDLEWTREYIEKGIITPESYFRRLLADVSVKEPLNVYINSPGGSVFSAYEMVNALREWKMSAKQPVNITLGAMVASAASMITVFMGSSVMAHRNSKMMFHGASSFIEGGKGALEDEAELLGKINAEVQQVLISKYSMSPEAVAEWFAEGRMGWLTSEEMKEAGIVSEIIDEDSEEIEFDSASIDAIGAKGLDIAALLEIKEEEEDNGDTKPAGDGEANPETEKTEPDPENPGTDQPEVPAEEVEPEVEPEVIEPKGDNVEPSEAEQVRAAEIESFVKQLAQRDLLIRDHQSARDKAEARIKELEQENKKNTQELTEKFEVQISDLAKSLEIANDRNSKLLGGAMTFEPAGPETWEDAMEVCNGDYAVTSKRYPKLKEAYIEKHKRK